MTQANLAVGKIFTNNTTTQTNQANAEQETITYEEVMVKLRNMRARPAQGVDTGVPTNVDLMTGEIGHRWQAERGNGREYIVIKKLQENEFMYTTESKE